MATLYRNWTVTVQDSVSPYLPISTLELHLFEGKCEIKTDPSTGLRKVFSYGTSSLATYAVDKNGANAIAFAPDLVDRPGEYDFIELDLNNVLTPNSKGGLTLYSVVGKPANATDFSSGRVIIDSTSLDDPNVKQTMATLGGGIGNVIDNLFFAGGTVQYTVSTLFTSDETVLYLDLTAGLPASITTKKEVISEQPPYFDTTLPASFTRLIPRFNIYYSNQSDVVAVWHSVPAYYMSDASIVLRLRGDQYSIYRTKEFGAGGGEVDLNGLSGSLLVSINVEDQNANFRSFNKDPQYQVDISGPESSLITAYQSKGIENIGLGQWGYTDQTTDMPIMGIDGKHARGFRFGTPTHPNLLTGLSTGQVKIAPASATPPLLSVGYGASATKASAVAIGTEASANGVYSMALGFQATASNPYSTAIGQNMTVAGNSSVGISLSASGDTLTTANVFAVVGGRIALGAVDAITGSMLTVSDDSAPAISVRNTKTTGTTSGDSLGSIDFASMEGVPANSGASISAGVPTSWGVSSFPTYLSFNTRTVSTPTSVERMRLKANGTLQIGVDNADVGNLLSIESTYATTPAHAYLGLAITTGANTGYFGQWSNIISHGLYMGYDVATTDAFNISNFIVYPSGQAGIGVSPTSAIGAEKFKVVASTPYVADFKALNQQTAYLSVYSKYNGNDAFTYALAYNVNNGDADTISSFGPDSSISAKNITVYYRTALSMSSVGIGTTAPLNALDIGAGGIGLGTYAGVNSAPAGGMIMDGELGIGTAAIGGPKLHTYGSGAEMAIFQNSGTSACRITIKNTKNPVSYAQIGIDNDGSAFFGVDGYTPNPAKNIYIDSSGNLGVGIATVTATYKMQVEGPLFVNGSVIAGINSGTTLGLASNRFTALYMSSTIDYATSLSFNIGATNIATLTADGALGIGTNSSDARLIIVNSVSAGIRDGLSIIGNLGIGTTPTALDSRGLLITTTATKGTSGSYYGALIAQTLTAGKTAGSYYGLYIANLSANASSISGNCYGIYVQAMTRSSIPGDNLSAYFGGGVECGYTLLVNSGLTVTAGGLTVSYGGLTYTGMLTNPDAVAVSAGLTSTLFWRVNLGGNYYKIPLNLDS
jgi:hypothetical protein